VHTNIQSSHIAEEAENIRQVKCAAYYLGYNVRY
jgi:hypothetical protein